MRQPKIQVQYDLFRPPQEVEMEALGKLVVKTVEKQCEKMRKAMWNRYTEQSRMIEEFRRRVENIERNICKGIEIDGIGNQMGNQKNMD